MLKRVKRVMVTGEEVGEVMLRRVKR